MLVNAFIAISLQRENESQFRNILLLKLPELRCTNGNILGRQCIPKKEDKYDFYNRELRKDYRIWLEIRDNIDDRQCILEKNDESISEKKKKKEKMIIPMAGSQTGSTHFVWLQTVQTSCRERERERERESNDF